MIYCGHANLLRIGALRVVAYPNDHRPAHVHVIGNSHEAVFELQVAVNKAKLRENYGFAQSEISAIRRTLIANLPLLVAEWERIHGTKE